MINEIYKYFAGELTSNEAELFMSEIYADENLKLEFVKIQQLFAYLDLLSQKDDEEKNRSSLSRFMQMVEKKVKEI